jgi:hypothetical protein
MTPHRDGNLSKAPQRRRYVGSPPVSVGRASLRFNNTTIRADDVVLRQATRRIEFAGSVTAFLGSSKDCADIPQLQSR